MTDDAPDPLDELLSAYVDDTASADERAVVERDPTLVARAERLRQVIAAVRDVPAPSEDEREASILGALAAFDEFALGAARPGQPAIEVDHVATTATPYDVHQSRRRWSPAGWMAAAAALIVVVLGVGALGNGDDSNSDSSASSDTAQSAALVPADGQSDEQESRAADTTAAAAAETVAAAADAVAPTLGEINGAASVDSSVADDAAGAATTSAATSSGGGDAGPVDAPPALTTDAELVEFVDGLPTDVAVAPATKGVPACAGRDLSGDDVGVIVWRGTLAHVITAPNFAGATTAIVVDVDCLELTTVTLG